MSPLGDTKSLAEGEGCGNRTSTRLPIWSDRTCFLATSINLLYSPRVIDADKLWLRTDPTRLHGWIILPGLGRCFDDGTLVTIGDENDSAKVVYNPQDGPLPPETCTGHGMRVLEGSYFPLEDDSVVNLYFND
jgi:hypothetical protein